MKGDPAIVLSALAVLNFLAVPVVLFVRLKCCRPETPSDLADGDWPQIPNELRARKNLKGSVHNRSVSK